jgi:hypothetical protein
VRVNPSDARWRKSSFSNGGTKGGDNCVEVAILADGQVAVRDTKDRSLAPHLFTASEWEAFLTGVKAGEFDRH